MLFNDRSDAGRQLATRLHAWQGRHPVILALPRGGVPIGFEIACALHAPLDLVLVRKIGAPNEPELAIGAVADGEHPELVVDERLVRLLGVSRRYLAEAKAAAIKELERRRFAYLKDRPLVAVNGRPAIVVDDGIATGATTLAALQATRRQMPSDLVLAVPVAPPDVIDKLRVVADEIVCLHAPDDLSAVGAYYRAFPQLRDAQVIALLDHAAMLPRDPSTKAQTR